MEWIFFMALGAGLYWFWQNTVKDETDDGLGSIPGPDGERYVPMNLPVPVNHNPEYNSDWKPEFMGFDYEGETPLILWVTEKTKEHIEDILSDVYLSPIHDFVEEDSIFNPEFFWIEFGSLMIALFSIISEQKLGNKSILTVAPSMFRRILMEEYIKDQRIAHLFDQTLEAKVVEYGMIITNDNREYQDTAKRIVRNLQQQIPNMTLDMAHDLQVVIKAAVYWYEYTLDSISWFEE